MSTTKVTPTSPPFRYSLAKKADLPEIKKVTIKSWSCFKPILTERHWNEMHSNLTNDSNLNNFIEKGYFLLALNSSDHIIGFACLMPNGNPTKVYDTLWSHLRLVTVDPDYQNRGIAKSLTKKCIQHAKESGEKFLALHSSEMMLNAIHIYEKLGFERIKELPKSSGKRYWLYMLKL